MGFPEDPSDVGMKAARVCTEHALRHVLITRNLSADDVATLAGVLRKNLRTDVDVAFELDFILDPPETNPRKQTVLDQARLDRHRIL
jgi:hypothetical protein